MTSEYIVIEKRECHNCGHKGLTDTEYVEVDGRRVSEGYVECPNCGEEKFAFCGVLKKCAIPSSIFELFAEEYAKALKLVRERNDACISLFQNELGYGFLKSKAILDIMRMSGIVKD